MTHLFAWGKNKWKKQIDHWLNRCTIVDLFSILFQWEGNEFEAWVNNFIQIICQPKAQVGALVHRNARTVNKIVTQSELYCHGEQFQDWPTVCEAAPSSLFWVPRLKRITGSLFGFSLQSDSQIGNGFFNRPIMTRSRKPRYRAGAQNKDFGAGLQTDLTASRRLKRALFKSDGKNPALAKLWGCLDSHRT